MNTIHSHHRPRTVPGLSGRVSAHTASSWWKLSVRKPSICRVSTWTWTWNLISSSTDSTCWSIIICGLFLPTSVSWHQLSSERRWLAQHIQRLIILQSLNQVKQQWDIMVTSSLILSLIITMILLIQFNAVVIEIKSKKKNSPRVQIFPLRKYIVVI